MKKHYLVTFFLVLAGAFLVSCAGKTAVQKTSPSFEAYSFNANNYAPKVNNFVVILDASYSMEDKSGPKTKSDTAREFLTALNETLPELGYNCELITFGPKNTVKINYGPTRYSTSGLGAALKAAHKPHGGTPRPLTQALLTAAGELKSSQGKTALIIVGDGDRVEPASVKAAKALKAQLGDKVCIYTVLVGDSPAGIKVFDQIAKAGGCGSSITANELGTSGKVAGFVEGIFLSKRAPKPVVKAVPRDSDGDGVTDDRDKCPNTPKGATVDARGCWTYAAEVLFGFDKSEINPDAYPMLDEAVLILKKNSKLNVQIFGHTDNTGSEAYNMKLSENRAKAIMKYFVESGVNATQLMVKGFGLTQPIVSNDTKEGRAKNRRVDLIPVK